MHAWFSKNMLCMHFMMVIKCWCTKNYIWNCSFDHASVSCQCILHMEIKFVISCFHAGLFGVLISLFIWIWVENKLCRVAAALIKCFSLYGFNQVLPQYIAMIAWSRINLWHTSMVICSIYTQLTGFHAHNHPDMTLYGCPDAKIQSLLLLLLSINTLKRLLVWSMH